LAIDTRDKRASLLAQRFLWKCVFPNPDPVINGGDRIQLLGLYRGFWDAAFRGEVIELTVQLRQDVSLAVER
jgi:hypothetical protein